MRHWFVIALAATVAVGWSSDALAGKKDKSKEKTEAPAEAAAEEAKGIEILETGLADVDSFFSAAKAPIDTITSTRNALDKINADLNTALGLTEGTPISDAFADLKAKAEGKLSVALDGTMPKISAADGVPENVSNAVAAINSGVDELTGLVDGLKELPAQFATLIQEGQKFTDPNTLKGMASNPVVAAKATPKVMKNIKALGDAKSEAEQLVDSVALLKKGLTTLGS